MDNVGGYILFDGRDFKRADAQSHFKMKISGIWDYFSNNLGKKPIFLKYPLIFMGEECAVILRECTLSENAIYFNNDQYTQVGESHVEIKVYKNDIIEMYEI